MHRCWCRRCGWGCGGLRRVEHIFLADSPSDAASGHLRQVNSMLLRELPDNRGHIGLAVRSRRGGRGSCGLSWSCRGRCRRCRSGGSGGGGSCHRRSGRWRGRCRRGRCRGSGDWFRRLYWSALGSGLWCRSRLSGSLCRGGGWGGRIASVSHSSKNSSHLDGFVLRHQNFLDNSGDGRGNLCVDLVGWRFRRAARQQRQCLRRP